MKRTEPRGDMATLEDLKAKLAKLPSAADLPEGSKERRVVRDARRFANNQTEDGPHIGLDEAGITQTLHALNKYFPPEAK